MPPPYLYKSIVWLNRNNQPFEDWLNDHCKHWEVFWIEPVPNKPDFKAVHMRRPLETDAPADPEDDETKTAFRRMFDALTLLW